MCKVLENSFFGPWKSLKSPWIWKWSCCTHPESCLTPWRWDKLENCCNLHLNIFVYKSLTNTLPPPLCNIFSRWITAIDTKLGLPPIVILSHKLIVVSRRKESFHLGVPPCLTFFPPGLKTPCQPLLIFLNGLAGYKCCHPAIVCSAILFAIVFKFLYV